MSPVRLLHLSSTTAAAKVTLLFLATPPLCFSIVLGTCIWASMPLQTRSPERTHTVLDSLNSWQQQDFWSRSLGMLGDDIMQLVVASLDMESAVTFHDSPFPCPTTPSRPP